MSRFAWPRDIRRQAYESPGEEPLDVFLVEQVVNVEACRPALLLQCDAEAGQVIGALCIEVVERPTGLAAMLGGA